VRTILKKRKEQKIRKCFFSWKNIYFKVKNILTEGTNKRVIFNIFYPFYRIYNPIVGYLRILNPLSNQQRITNSLQQNFFLFCCQTHKLFTQTFKATVSFIIWVVETQKSTPSHHQIFQTNA